MHTLCAKSPEIDYLLAPIRRGHVFTLKVLEQTVSAFCFVSQAHLLVSNLATGFRNPLAKSSPLDGVEIKASGEFQRCQQFSVPFNVNHNISINVYLRHVCKYVFTDCCTKIYKNHTKFGLSSKICTSLMRSLTTGVV